MSISIVCPYELIGPPTISNLNSLQLDSIAFISTKESKLNFTNYLHTYVVSIATYSREFSWTKSRNKKSISRAIFDTYDGRCLWTVASTGKRNRSSSYEVISDLLYWSLDPTTNFETTNSKVHEYFDLSIRTSPTSLLIVAFSLKIICLSSF